MPLLDSYWDFFYARNIMDVMSVVVNRNCTGCENGCLSQREHSCLYFTKQEQLELYFDDIMRDVNEEEVLRMWHEAVSSIEYIPSEVVALYKLKLNCRDWRETDMKTDTWVKKIISMCIRLYHLENRF